VRVTAIGSADSGPIGVHGNAGLARGGASDELAAAGAVTVAASPRLTISGELLVRRLADLHPVTTATLPDPLIAGVETMRLVPGANGSTLASAVTGVKWNPHATLVVTGQVWWRLGNAGLTAPFVPTVAIDYLF
jgi:hypothetical protein